MLDSLKHFFSKNAAEGYQKNGRQSTHDVHVATCALFVEMARIYDKFTQTETETILSILQEKYGLDITWSTYASEGGNFGFFTSHETMKRLNSKMYAEAKRLGVKWILGGECGHMWRVLHQYMDTMNGPADFLEKVLMGMAKTDKVEIAAGRQSFSHNAMMRKSDFKPVCIN